MTAPVLVLTATISPPATIRDLTRRDAAQRRADYGRALSRWRDLVGGRWRVLFAENSGHDLHRDEQLALEGVELLAVTPSASEEKGVGEALLLDAVVTHLQREAVGGTRVLVKSTGRLVVPNARDIVEIDRIGIQPMLKADHSYFDSRFFAIDQGTWARHFTGMADEVREADGRYLEHVLADRAVAASRAGVPILPFRRLPAHEGTSGTTGRSYATPWLRARRVGHDLLKQVAPRWCPYL